MCYEKFVACIYCVGAKNWKNTLEDTIWTKILFCFLRISFEKNCTKIFQKSWFDTFKNISESLIISYSFIYFVLYRPSLDLGRGGPLSLLSGAGLQQSTRWMRMTAKVKSSSMSHNSIGRTCCFYHPDSRGKLFSNYPPQILTSFQSFVM
jgi:hypothetical protein